MNSHKFFVITLLLLTNTLLFGQEQSPDTKMLIKENGNFVETCEFISDGVQYTLQGSTLYVSPIEAKLKLGERRNFRLDYNELKFCVETGAIEQNCDDGVYTISTKHNQVQINGNNFSFNNIGEYVLEGSYPLSDFLECIVNECSNDVTK